MSSAQAARPSQGLLLAAITEMLARRLGLALSYKFHHQSQQMAVAVVLLQQQGRQRAGLAHL
jgi:hypothetical protein